MDSVIKIKDKSLLSCTVALLESYYHCNSFMVNKCHPAYQFPGDWLIYHSQNHWANEDTMLEYIQKVIVPFVEIKRETLNLNSEHPALAIFDQFKGQLTEKVTNELEENYIHSVIDPSCLHRPTTAYGYIC